MCLTIVTYISEFLFILKSQIMLMFDQVPFSNAVFSCQLKVYNYLCIIQICLVFVKYNMTCVWFGDYHKFLYTTNKNMWWSSTFVLCFGSKVQQTYGITLQALSAVSSSHVSKTVWGLF